MAREALTAACAGGRCRASGGVDAITEPGDPGARRLLTAFSPEPIACGDERSLIRTPEKTTPITFRLI